MNHAARLIITASDANTRLGELFLSERHVHRIVRAGITERRRSTPLHPRNHAGFNDWAGCIAEARALLLPEGWTMEDDAGLPLIVSPDGRFSFTVASGDGATGNPDATPRTKYTKGTKTIEAAARNSQLTIPMLELPAPVSSREFWILLRGRRSFDRTVYLEFSKPSALSKDETKRAYVSDWSERIIIPSISESRVVPENLQSETTGEIDIQINRI